MHSTSALQIAVISLIAVVVAVPLAKHLGVGAVLGYLAAGLLLGLFDKAREQGSDILAAI